MCKVTCEKNTVLMTRPPISELSPPVLFSVTINLLCQLDRILNHLGNTAGEVSMRGFQKVAEPEIVTLNVAATQTE